MMDETITKVMSMPTAAAARMLNAHPGSFFTYFIFGELFGYYVDFELKLCFLRLTKHFRKSSNGKKKEVSK